MGGINRKRNRRNRIYRRIAVALTVALLAGQSHAFVLAQEDAGDVPQTEASAGDTGADAAADGSTGNIGSSLGQDNYNEDDADERDTGEDEFLEDGNGPDAGQSSGNDGNTEDDQEGGDQPGECICETACTEDAVNAECPVCAGDYAACAWEADDGDNNDTGNGNTENNEPEGQGVNLSEEVVPVLEDSPAVDEGIAMLADEGVETLMVGEEFIYDGIKYVVTGDCEIKVGKQGDNAVSGEITIPESFEKDGITYRVTSIGERAFLGFSSLNSVEISEGVISIGERAFEGCSGLIGVKIPRSVTSIESYAFINCTSLASIEIPDSVTSIGEWAFTECRSLTSVKIPQSITSIEEGVFQGCSSLTSVEIPDSVTSMGPSVFNGCSSLTSVEIPDSVTSIGRWAFTACRSLTSVRLPISIERIEYHTFAYCDLSSIEIPKSVTSIGEDAFYSCQNLTSVTISENVVNIGRTAFGWCKNLNELRIVVSTEGNFRFPTVDSSAFVVLPNERYVVFIDENGTELRGERYENAKAAFTEAAGNGGDSADGKWYGWSLKEPSGVAEDTCEVTINVQKDNGSWPDHNRTFALTKDSGTTFVTDLNAVEAGNYLIYDVTGLADGEFRTKGVNTGVPVTVADTDVSAGVDYYTVTFCDYDAAAGETVYGDNTDQRPQTVLKTAGRAARPADPMKAGHTFDKWVTAPGGEEEFNFGSAEITAPTKIYAKWTENTVPAFTYTVTINVKKDGNDWNRHGRTFALLEDGGGFLEVPGQSADSAYKISQVPDGTYSIYDTTGVQSGSFYSRARDTGMDVRVGGTDTEVDVTVNGADAEGTVHYYTVTFYDGADAYGAGTPQQPQTVLKGKQAAEPDDPEKEGWQFAGWKTADGTPYGFDSAIADTTDIFAGWIKRTEGQDQLRITASAGEGGSISPVGHVPVTEGGEVTFTVTPDEGYRIKAVAVDGRDATPELQDSPARVQTEARYYTFTNVTENHTIHASFERDGNSPGGDDPNPGGGGNNTNPGGSDDGNHTNPGGSSTGDSSESGGGGDHSGSGGGSDSGSSSRNSSTGNGQMTLVSEMASAPAGENAADSTGSVQTFTGQESGNTAVRAVRTTAEGSGAGAPGQAADGTEPKTGDAAHMEIYATIAMVAGLTYLLLYFMEESRGMSEREKDAFVAAFIRWGKKGGAFRKGCAVAAIFCLLMYYHAIGKRVGQNALSEKYLGQAW